MSNLLSQLKKLKHSPKAGAVSLSQHETAKARLLARVSVDLPVRQESRSYVSWYLSSFISKPVTFGVAATTIFVGSLSTVNAASNSLPGDTLYSVKRITEQAQLKIASLDRRAVLHTEFAERRLREATELRSTSEDGTRLVLAKTAMVEYATELSQASADLKSLKGSAGSSATLAVVNNVQNKIDSMKAVIDETAAKSVTVETGNEVAEAKQITKEAQEAVTNVVVDVHEEDATEKSGQELKSMFTKELGSIEARQTFDRHRLETITAAIKADVMLKGMEGIPTDDDLKRMTYVITQTETQIPEAMNRFAAGGFRDAFATLQGIDTELLDLESRLADVEILVMNAKAEAAQKAADEAAKEIQEQVDAEAVTGEEEIVPVTPAS